MQISELRDEFQRRLTGFLWGQWGQMGILAATDRRDSWAADPEALLLLSFEVGRGDPRLFEEVLDWLLVNERQISVQRMRNLARDEGDRALVEAVLGWLGQHRRRARLDGKQRDGGPADQPQSFFRDSRLPVRDPDPAFLAQGFLKADPGASGNSLAPDFALPINFAFRLRALLGVGAKAEVMRVLLTTDAPRVNVQVVAASTAFTKRNVQEALNSLRAAGAVTSSELGNEQRFEAATARWRGFLGLEQMPSHMDWPQLFAAYRLILRWLNDPAIQEFSDYLLFSETRSLAEEVIPDLHFAGISIGPSGPARPDYLSDFAEQLLAAGPI